MTPVTPTPPPVRVVVFGTGSSAERAWHAAVDIDRLRVVAFADNDRTKWNRTFHGLPVLPPAELGGGHWDFVVLASQWADEIAAQLRTLGIDEERVIRAAASGLRTALERLASAATPKSEVRLSGGRTVLRRNLPKVLILTHETLNESHGTGVLLKRYFDHFPPSHLFNFCRNETGQPWLANSAVLTGAAPTGLAVRQILDRHGFVPDLVYATAFNENDLPLLGAVLRSLPSAVPVVQHFMDYVPHDTVAFEAEFKPMLSRVTQIWALTESMRAMIAARMGRDVELVTALQQEVPALWKGEHRLVGPGFRTVLLGNLWQPWVLPILRDAWREVRSTLPGVLPIEWYVHPQRVQAVMDAGCDPGFEIVWRGFITGQALQERLREADLAVVPFNRESTAANDYARYSLPSRLTELASAGLPLFAIASPDTEPARFVARHEIGRAAAGPDPAAITTALVDFLRDTAARERAGAAARRLAEREFQLAPFQEWLHGRLLDLVHGIGGGSRAKGFRA